MAGVPKRLATDNPSPRIPDDVLIEIFLHLPVRSLFLFRSVCKHWLRLIQNPSFIISLLYRPIKNHYDHKPVLILRSTKPRSKIITDCPFNKNIVFTLMSDDEKVLYKDEVSLETLSPSMYRRHMLVKKDNLRLLGPCNGLFCLTDRVDAVVFNPVTRQCRQVPRSYKDPFCSSFKYDHVFFGFDSVSNDYKLVGIPNKDAYSSASTDPSDRHHYGVEIFSLSKNTWSQVDCVVPASDVHLIRNNNVFFNGAFHWFGCDFYNISSIVVFELNKEVFKLFQFPDNLPRYYHRTMYLSVLDEYFTIVAHMGSDHKLYPDDEFEIWVMKEYGVHSSWTKLHNINTGMAIRSLFSLCEDGEFLLEDFEGRLVSFNLNTKDFKKLEVPVVPKFAFRYRESLISPGRSKEEENVKGESRIFSL